MLYERVWDQKEWTRWFVFCFLPWIRKWRLMVDSNEYWRSSHYEWWSYYLEAHGCLTSCCPNGELLPVFIEQSWWVVGRTFRCSGYRSWRWNYFCSCSCWFSPWSCWEASRSGYVTLGMDERKLMIGIHPTTIAQSFQNAATKAVEFLEGMSTPVDLNDREALLRAAGTSLNSKVS